MQKITKNILRQVFNAVTRSLASLGAICREAMLQRTDVWSSVGFPGSVPAHPDPVSWPEGARAKALFAIEHAHYYIPFGHKML